MEQHRLLQKQIQRFLPPHIAEDEAFKIFLEAVSDTYQIFERDKALSDNAFDISEKEYRSLLENLTVEYVEKKKAIDRVTHLIKKVDSQFQFQNEQTSTDLETILSFLESRLEKIIQLEKELQKNEERFKLAIEGSSDGIWDYDIIEQKLFLSDHLLALIGQLPENETPLIEQLFEWIHPDDVDISKQTFINHIKSKIPIEIIVRVKNKEGIYKYFLVRGNSLWNNSQRAYRTAGSITDFTERILLQEEQRLTNEVAKIGSWQMSLDGRQLHFSNITREIFECEDTRLIDLNYLLSQIEETDRNILSETLKMCIQNHKPFDLEIKLIHPDKNKKWIRLKGETLWENNIPVKIFGIVRNITERKNLEASLLTSEQNLRGILDSTDTGYALLDNSFNIIHINKALINFAENNAGMMSNVLRPNNYYLNALPKERRNIVETQLKKVLEGNSISYEIDYPQKDGGEKNYLSKFFPIAFENNTSHGIVISIQDITSNKKAEEALKNSEERFRSLVTNISDLILLIDKDGHIIYQSESVEKTLGYKETDSLGKNIQDYVHPEDYNTAINSFWNSLSESGTSQLFETRLRHKNGHYIHVEAQGNNQWRNPAIESIIIVARDISERIIAQQELLNKSKLLEATAEVAMRLSKDENKTEILQDAFSIIGNAVRADRVYLFENGIDKETGKDISYQILEWVSNESYKQSDNKDLQNLPVDELAPFFTPLLKNLPFIAHVEEMEDGPGKELLKQQAIQSILLLPIFIHNNFYGLIGLDACKAKRIWTSDEISVLLLLAKTIGSSFENKQYKIDLETSNQRYTQVSKATSDAIWEIDLVEKKNLYWGGVYEKLFGYQVNNTPVDLHDWYIQIHPDERDAILSDLLNFISEKKETYWFAEYRYKKANNSYAYVIDRGLLIFDDQQNAIKMVGAMQDVTTQKKQTIERELVLQISALIAQNEKLEDGLYHTIEIIAKHLDAKYAQAWFPDIEGTKLTFKTDWIDDTTTNLESKGSLVATEMPKGIIQESWKNNAILFQAGTPEILHEPSFTVDLKTLALPIVFNNKVTAVFSFVFNESSTFVYHENDAFLKEVSTQTGAGIQRKHIEEELNQFFNISPDLLCIIGPDGFFKKINPAFEELLGFTNDTILNNEIKSWVHPDDLEKTIKNLILPTPEQKTSSLENRFITSTGEIKWLSWTAIYDIETELRYAVAKDITEKIRLSKIIDKERSSKINEVTNAALTAQENERQELGRELHDNINQILVSCRLYLSLIKLNDPEQNNYLKMTDGMIKDAIKELRQLSHTLLPATLSDSNLIKALDNIFQTAIKSGRLEVARDFSRFNQDHLNDHLKLNIYRIVQEQFNNILKHANANRVYIRLENMQDGIELEISDNGKGAEFEKILKGVGLTNIRSRVSLFAGEVIVHTSPGEGFNLKVKLKEYK